MGSINRLILITGASGYVGSQTAAAFLAQGYRVRLAGRNQSSCDRMVKVHAAYKDKVETIQVDNITDPHAFDKAVIGVDGVVHMASPFTYAVQDTEKDLIVPAVNGTLRMLESIRDHAPQVRRLVLTSSFAAIVDLSKGLWPGHVYNEKQWNPMTYEKVKAAKQALAYAGSKKLAEEAAWQFLKDNGSQMNLTLSTINPVMIYGPPLPGSVSLAHLGQSPGEIYALMNKSLTAVPPSPMPVFVDVRDVAEAHLRAYESEQSGRFSLCSGHFTKDEVCKIFRERLPQIKDRVPSEPSENNDLVPEAHYSVDSTRAQEVLGIQFRGLEETFLDMAKAFLELEEASDSKVL